MHRYKELQVWKKSRAFASIIYKVTSTFPPEEKFGLTNQLRRAAVSIPSNIAEGASRKSNKDFARFIEIAIGSANEIDTQLLIGLDLDFISIAVHSSIDKELQSIIKMLSKFKSTLK